jgi:pentatricopeptide repeat protein
VQCGHVIQAQELFNKSRKKDLYMYGAMMKGYITNNQSNMAIDLFHQVKNPDEILFTLLFNACAQLGTKQSLNSIEKYLKDIENKYHSNSYIITSLIDAFMKCGDVNRAQILFQNSKIKVLHMYGAMIKGFYYFH